MLTMGSLFDGAGTMPFAATLCGIKPVWSSEIEKFPCEVTKRRFPDVKQLGDVAKINGAEIEPVDIITFGSPCQDLSVAGTRTGLSGQRSGLFMEAVRIIKEMRENAIRTNQPVRPRYAVWENVPGAYSSNKGEDFRVVLEELCKVVDSEVSIPRPTKGKWERAGAIVGDAASRGGGIPLLGEHWTLNIGECPKDVEESGLWQILEERVHPKYYLSARACIGILRRAERRGKELPKLLKEALGKQAYQ